MIRNVLTAGIVGSFALGSQAGAAPPVSLDISSGFNYDAVATQAELDALDSWYDGSQSAKTLPLAFGTSGNSHDHLNMYGQGSYYHKDGDATTLQSTLTTSYGTYEFGPFDNPPFDTADHANPMDAALNAIRMTTDRGTSQSESVTVTLPAAQQTKYSSLNALVTGSAFTSDTRAWFRIYAIYQDSTQVLVYESPRDAEVIASQGTADRPGGVPLGQDTVTLSIDEAAVWHEVVLNTTQYVSNNIGSSPVYSQVRTDLGGELRMWELNDTGGVALDSTKILVGLKFEVDNEPSPWWVGYSEGDEVNVYAVTAMPGATPPGGGDPGEDFYIDPVNGSIAGDGSFEDPWKTLQGVIEANRIETRRYSDHPDNTTFVAVNPGAPVGPGDTLWLYSGYHGEVDISEAYNAQMITVTAAPGETPTLSGLHLQSAENWTFKGLSISASHAATYVKHILAEIEGHNWLGAARHITIEDCEVFSVPDASVWSDSDWVNTACIGIQAKDASYISIVDNHVFNVRFGINAYDGDNTYVGNNVIEDFSADGIRGLSNSSVYEYNVIKDCVPLTVSDSNHDDGFQSWSGGTHFGSGTGVITDVVLRGNLFINDTDFSDGATGSMQAIGCFDGMYEDWLIVNNVIITDHYHGISLYGAQDCTIINNTVLDPYAGSPGPAWILIHAHKNGTTGTGNVIRNNVAASFTGATGTTLDHNLDLSGLTLTNVFVDPVFDANGFDLHLVSGSPAIDAGSATGAPTVDRDGVSRPQGTAVDEGAYELTP